MRKGGVQAGYLPVALEGEILFFLMKIAINAPEETLWNRNLDMLPSVTRMCDAAKDASLASQLC